MKHLFLVSLILLFCVAVHDCQWVFNKKACFDPPGIQGKCRATIVRYTYNQTTGTCEKFIYGGCQGNENRFPLESICKHTCANIAKMNPDNKACFDPPGVKGKCRAGVVSYTYNQTTGTCQKFIYGGCKGNENRFPSESICDETCGDVQPSDMVILN